MTTSTPAAGNRTSTSLEFQPLEFLPSDLLLRPLDAVEQLHPLLSARIDLTFNRVPHFRRVFWSLIRMLTRIISLSIPSAFAVALLAQTSTPANTVSEPTRTAVRELIGSIMVDGKAYEYDRELADGIGPRLTGSANYDRAVAWSMEHFRSLGLSNVHTECLRLLLRGSQR